MTSCRNFKIKSPIHCRFRPVSESPSRHSDEKDVLLVLDVWTAAKNGDNAIQIESEVPLDSFRVRRLLAYWLLKGDLIPLDDSVAEYSLLESEKAV